MTERELVTTQHAVTNNVGGGEATQLIEADQNHHHDHNCHCSEVEFDDEDEESSMNHDDQIELLHILEEKAKHRIIPPELPQTVTILDCFPPLDIENFPSLLDEAGNVKPFGKVYLVGTAHFSEESQNDVTKTIQQTQPDCVMVELCQSRTAILSMDEQKLLDEAKNLNMEKIMANIRQSGVVQGIMHCMLLSMSAHVTKQLGMAPGGEFRAAFREFQNVPRCRLQLGDRPIQITLQRAFGSLSAWQKMRLFGGLLWSHGMKITKEDIEKAKRKDLLEEILREMAGEFPALSRIFVDERDQYMAHVLRCLAQDVYLNRCQLLIGQNRPLNDMEKYPVTVVGVVGIGHAPGIAANWTKSVDISKLLQVPEKSKWPRYFVLSIKGALIGIASYIFYKGGFKLYAYCKR